jgi:hypothetical protein
LTLSERESATYGLVLRLHSGRVTWRRWCLTWRRLIGPSDMCVLTWTNQVLPRPYARDLKYFQKIANSLGMAALIEVGRCRLNQVDP